MITGVLRAFLILLVCSVSLFLKAQDTAMYNVLHYDIHVKVEPNKEYISGYNTILCRVQKTSDVLFFDLVPDMKVNKIVVDSNELLYFRKQNKVIATLKKTVSAGDVIAMKVYFEGKPLKAKLAPWNGGFDWKTDNNNKPWVGLACESKGAAIWLPCKDDWSDEPESMDMYLSVPDTLVGVSNGRLKEVSKDNGYATYHWQVINPINNYNISINVGDYVHISDTFYGINKLSLDYYVLRSNVEKARRHFKEVDTMLRAFEHYFGAYPFPEDGYKLVETPYWGMEHQSCVAYGNKYRYNEYGFDFIIVHESGHEWFANSITAADPADMWIHESFTTYSEALFVEYTQGKAKALAYLQMQIDKVVNQHPMQGPRHQNYHGWKDNDIYYKGSWVLQTLRYSVNNDSLWYKTLREYSTTFRHQLIQTEDVISFFNKRLPGISKEVFYQYLNHASLPVLAVAVKTIKGKQVLEYQWMADRPNFKLNLQVPSAVGTVVLKAGKGKQRIKVPQGFSIEDVMKLKEVALIEIGRL